MASPSPGCKIWKHSKKLIFAQRRLSALILRRLHRNTWRTSSTLRIRGWNDTCRAWRSQQTLRWTVYGSQWQATGNFAEIGRLSVAA
ncbi:hypothetical protein JG687_00017264 [Phytophthora cactorum]|uniref:Uncharacterized protein n=1 Tax=Phytophthora cactorum TaxID=29920 RepID=A0A8T1TQR1_9STRA|nr:hypothetical protein JG687_00017264 [Phytophthora cactorum]